MEKPTTRQEKIDLIKKLVSGQLTIEDINNEGYEITLNLGGPPPETRDPKTIYVTLNL